MPSPITMGRNGPRKIFVRKMSIYAKMKGNPHPFTLGQILRGEARSAGGRAPTTPTQRSCGAKQKSVPQALNLTAVDQPGAQAISRRHWLNLFVITRVGSEKAFPPQGPISK